ncbi:NnrU family protein [Sulfitobacter donghicola]|uniref:Membrane protein n=1 Tax=Sulfitobacter donghicola DSW-25 = KCTC 12864 = JCM 14565 TaxID=1300350 RepID=A0A073IWI5_9RHOB|nr:NnrU family protein [Sulfitobacter donghicola]KEJ89742.1 membrane protein [Sulfitobacter donghicola DSW-25 = KCTC 12864 = JCM 14565]KIN67157.1 NnrU family protein [Sulfitobacter donghicola DSW-25 = KCTC 12864 = JCM 14565]
MFLLILGVALWTAAHYFKRLMPDQRIALGAPGKGIMAVAIVASLILMIVGYRMAAFIPIWTPPAIFSGFNNGLMLLALWVYGSSAAKGAKAWPAYKTRHPQLLAVKIWALAHLLVNGDLASIILFGGILGWAVGSVILINKAEPNWTAPERAERPTYIRLAVISVVLFAVIAGIHIALGVNPFS